MATETTTSDPFERLHLACLEVYRDRQAVACIFVMSHDTQKAFVRHEPHHLAGWTERSGSSLRGIVAPGTGKWADVDLDDHLPYGLVRARFELPSQPVSTYFWQEFTVMAVGER